MSILVLKNIQKEAPGTIEDFLLEHKLPYEIIELSAGEKIPDTDNYDTLVMLGGPMSVNDFNIHTYLTDEFKCATEFINQGKKVLGICLGAQIIAKALGAKIYKGPQEEIGWYDIKFTPEALEDNICQSFLGNSDKKAVTQTVPVFHWHGETFDLPEGAKLLASSDLYQNQAFRYGNKVYALQFHIEITENIINRWFKNDRETLNTIKTLNRNNYSNYLTRAKDFYRAFFLRL